VPVVPLFGEECAQEISTFYRRLQLSFKGYRIQHKVELGKAFIEAECVEIGNVVFVEDRVGFPLTGTDLSK
jgi:hypothetical protein